MKKLLFMLFMVSTISSSQLIASAVAGGDITYTCVGQDSFLVKFSFYRDCNGSYPGTANIFVKCMSTGAVIDTLVISQPSSIDITPLCGASCSRCDSSSCTFPYGIEQYEYIQLMVFDSNVSCCDIILSYKDFQRSSGISIGASTSFEIQSTLNRCLTSQNNSIDFNSPLIAIMCIGQDFKYNHSPINIDTNQNGSLLDSISYSCICPINVPPPISGNYDCCKPLFFWGFPNSNLPFPRGFHMDNVTGNISFRPMKIEESIIAIKIQEFRKINGVSTKIGEVIREMKLIVISCPNNNAPVLSGPYYKEICAGNTINFTINTNDYDTSDTLTISYGNNIVGASWSDNNDSVKHPTGNFSWTPGQNLASSIPHIFTVTVKDDACPVMGSSTRAYQILVKPRPKAIITVIDSGCGNIWLSAQATLGKSPTYQWVGNFFPGFSNTGNTMHYDFDTAGKYPYAVTMTAQQCQHTYFDTIEIEPYSYISLPKDTFICAGSNFTINADLSNFYTNYSYYWSTGDSNIASQALYNIQSDTLVEVYFTDSNSCLRKDQIFIKVFQNPILTFSNPSHVCMKDSLKVSIQYVLDNTNLQQIAWTDILRNITLGSQLIQMISDSGLFSVQLIDDHGCSSTDTFDVAISNLTVNLGNTIKGCPNDTFTINPIINNAGGQNKYFWSNGDLTKKGTITNVLKDGSVSLTVTDFRNCPVTNDVFIDVSDMDLLLGDDKHICEGETVTFIANNFLNPFEKNPKIEWYSLNDSTFYDTSKVIIAKTNNHFRCYLTNKLNCQIWEDVSVIVQPLPTVDAGIDDTFCATDNSIILAGSPTLPLGIWSGKGISLVSGNYFFDPTNKTIYDGENCALVYVYTESTGCKNEDTLFYKVFNPSFPIYPQSYKQVCHDQSPFLLTGSPEGGFYTGYGVVNKHYFDPSITGIGIQTIYYHVGSFNCRRTKSTIIEVMPPPQVSLTTINGKTTFCKEEGLVQLLFSPSGGIYGGYFTGAVIDNKYFNADTAEGNYQIVYHFNDNIGCYNSDTLNLIVKNPYVEILKDISSVCNEKSIELTADYDVAEGVQWLNEIGVDGYFSGSTTSKSAMYQHGADELINHGFWLKVKTTDPVCMEASDSIWIEIGEYPKAGYSTDIFSGIEPLNIQFTDTSSIQYGVISTYQWDFGDGNSSNWKNPLHQYQQTGMYDVKLKVSSDLNCADSILKNKLIDVWSVGLDDLVKPGLSVYPNPAKDQLIIQSYKKINSIQLYDVIGKENIFINDINQTEFHLKATNLSAGLWILKIEFEDASIELKKVVIE